MAMLARRGLTSVTPTLAFSSLRQRHKREAPSASIPLARGSFTGFDVLALERLILRAEYIDLG
jgi:hypothetical protein